MSTTTTTNPPVHALPPTTSPSAFDSLPQVSLAPLSTITASSSAASSDPANVASAQNSTGGFTGSDSAHWMSAPTYVNGADASCGREWLLFRFPDNRIFELRSPLTTARPQNWMARNPACSSFRPSTCRSPPAIPSPKSSTRARRTPTRKSTPATPPTSSSSSTLTRPWRTTAATA
ncbi:hypothetical protein DFJ73DRAFT_880877 [Zopfochytrium polystomum]|nr:hypothetical protein DFJ73DRAFT_880877 [Zopfochytrium polystomum]